MSKAIGIIFIILGILSLSIVVVFTFGWGNYWTVWLDKNYPQIFGLIMGIMFLAMGIITLKET